MSVKTESILGTIGYMGGIMNVPEPFCFAWGNMLVYSQEALCQPGEHIHPDHTKLSLHDYARNDLLSRMRGDWMLMLDTDVAFEPDFAARLVGTMYRHNVDVLTGCYVYKKPPHYPVLYLYNPETGRQDEIVARWDRNREIFPIDSAGGGCLLVKRQVFERITGELNENPFDRIDNKGEDHSFFYRLRKLNIKAYCAWKVQMQHLEYVGFTLDDYVPDPEVAHEFVREGFSDIEAARALA